MTWQELIDNLTRLGVHPDRYSLDGLRGSDCVCVVREEGDWRVYYVERDRPKELSAFSSLSEAYDAVYSNLYETYA